MSAQDREDRVAARAVEEARREFEVLVQALKGQTDRQVRMLQKYLGGCLTDPDLMQTVLDARAEARTRGL